MDDETIYGKIIASISAKKAKELKRICNYNIITIELRPYKIEFDIKEFFTKNKITDKKEKEHLTRLQDKYITCSIGLYKTMKERNIKHVITFHDFINNCKFFSYILKKITNFNIQYIDGSMNIKTRKNIIDNFQDINYSILCSAKVLQEGVDIPKCDGIIFIDPKTSIIDTVQSLSRCLTKTDEFKEGNIMIPFDEKIDLINDEYTNNTRLILRNLVENDENLKEFFKEIIILDLDNMTEKEINLLEELKIKYKIDVNSKIIKDLREISYSTFTEARKIIKEKYTHFHDYQYNVINDFQDSGILLPINANIIYKKFGWISWEHYLGLENEMTNRRIKMIIYKENEIRKKKNMEIIDSKDKFNKFINENPELGIPLINVEYDNWIKFLLKDFDKIVEQYYKKNVLIDIFIKYQIYNKEKYIECMNYDKKLINYEYIINGFYNDSTSFNINDFYITRKKRR